MTGPTQQCETIDVGSALARCAPGHQVMRFAPLGVGAAKDATSIPGDQRELLCSRGIAPVPPLPEDLTVAIKQHPDKVGSTRDLFEQAVRNRTSTDHLGWRRIK